MRTYAYIDASNLFYGGKKSLGWSIDYEKLYKYLKQKYNVSKVYYFGGVETHKFIFDYQKHDSVSIKDLEYYFKQLSTIGNEEKITFETSLLYNHSKRIRFFMQLEKFGYHLVLKPIKTYRDTSGNITRKANCDVDMTLCLLIDQYVVDKILVLSGDGDFLPVLKHLRNNRKEIIVLSRGPRTSKEIRRFAGGNFKDFDYLRKYLEFTKDN